MAHIDPFLGAAPVAGIAGPHQSTVATILRGVKLGLFTAAEADAMIARISAHLTALPVASSLSIPDGVPATNSELGSGTLLAQQEG
ncbi:hypothetical protein [Actinophytocola sp.]|uniref:hypothetical protein n=1 Tax=Actinophytocola sp. TaxID=1872138 RepID=UPI002ED4816E